MGNLIGIVQKQQVFCRAKEISRETHTAISIRNPI